MRAWQITERGEPRDVLKQITADLGAPGPGELFFQIEATALGFPDVLMCRGLYPLSPPMPFTPGQEFVGTVIAAGPGTSTPVGARLMGVAAFMVGKGTFADRCASYEAMVFPAPQGMPASQAAAFTIGYHTAYLALERRAQLKAGEVLLVLGAAGGTGAAAIQVGKAMGARVIAVAGGADKGEVCKKLGADDVIDSKTASFVEAVTKLTAGKGADVIYDPVGGETFESAINCIASEGRLLPIGFASGRWGKVDPQTFALKNISLVGALGGGFPPADMQAMHQRLLALYNQGKLTPFIDKTIGFEEIRDGLQIVADRKVRGRIVAIF